jgi:uncharacterized protein DUF998
VTRWLLACGVVAGPLFMVVSLVQAFTRQGFDLRRPAISMLSLGDLGWIQIANSSSPACWPFALAVGVRRALHPGRAGTWGPPLIGAYGVGFTVAFIGLIAACFVFARRFAGLQERGWATYCAATGVVACVLIGLGMSNVVPASVSFAVMGVVTSGWIAAIALRLLSEQGDAQAVKD